MHHPEPGQLARQEYASQQLAAEADVRQSAALHEDSAQLLYLAPTGLNTGAEALLSSMRAD
jgi:hypothetical protein